MSDRPALAPATGVPTDLTEVPAGATLGAALRLREPGKTWSEVRQLCASGKVIVDGQLVLDAAHRLRGGERLEVRMNAPDPRRQQTRPGFRVVFEDGHLIIIEKPEGVSSVPYERKETGTALDLIRAEWRRQGRRASATPLYTVHRIDKDTSGLLCFAKTRLAERGMHVVFQRHLAERLYIAVAHGQPTSERIESYLIADRGDGLRGSTRFPREGQRAATNVRVVERLAHAAVCEVRLETGRTHQIRIHLAERGHPLVGETVYIRDFTRRGDTLVRSERLLLHAATLGFEHPVTKSPLSFQSELPPDFQAILQRLRAERRGRGDGGRGDE